MLYFNGPNEFVYSVLYTSEGYTIDPDCYLNNNEDDEKIGTWTIRIEIRRFICFSKVFFLEF